MSTIYKIEAESDVGSVNAGDQFAVYKTSSGRTMRASGLEVLTYVLGTSTSDALGFYGVATVTQPTSSLQAAIASTAAASVSATQWGYSTSTQADAIVTLANQLRSNLVS